METCKECGQELKVKRDKMIFDIHLVHDMSKTENPWMAHYMDAFGDLLTAGQTKEHAISEMLIYILKQRYGTILKGGLNVERI